MPVQLDNRTQRREKRCSCENLKDKECVYFCHIGIVWINTPSQIIPYGVGSFQMRLRRDVARCLCRNKHDTECRKFCSHWYSEGEDASVSRYSPGKSKERYKITVKRWRYSAIQKT
ncbi:hypothetical protein NFI96_011826 [Prochilodus magdalenae]|nr:hypothetical protein NFI96_011826 [Prochilodus magdalenae]